MADGLARLGQWWRTFRQLGAGNWTASGNQRWLLKHTGDLEEWGKGSATKQVPLFTFIETLVRKHRLRLVLVCCLLDWKSEASRRYSEEDKCWGEISHRDVKAKFPPKAKYRNWERALWTTQNPSRAVESNDPIEMETERCPPERPSWPRGEKKCFESSKINKNIILHL